MMMQTHNMVSVFSLEVCVFSLSHSLKKLLVQELSLLISTTKWIYIQW